MVLLRVLRLRTMKNSRLFSTIHPTAPLELTIAIIKPHAVLQPWVVEDVHAAVTRDGFITVHRKVARLTRNDASEFYKEHFGKFYFQRAVELMSSGPIVVNLLARFQAIQRWRSLMGPTKVSQTHFSHPDCLRSKFGLTDTRNAVHGSDSIASTARECGFFFPEFNAEEWYRSTEPVLRLSARSIPQDWRRGVANIPGPEAGVIM